MYRAWPGIPSRWKRGGAHSCSGRPSRCAGAARARRRARSTCCWCPGPASPTTSDRGRTMRPTTWRAGAESCASRAGVAYASIGAGPASHPLAPPLVRRCAARGALPLLPRARFEAFATEIGVDTANDPVLPDLVFSLPHPGGIPPRIRGRPAPSASASWRTRAGMSTGPGGGRDLRGLSRQDRLARPGLLDAGCSVRLLIGNRGSDVRTVRHLREALASIRARRAGVSSPPTSRPTTTCCAKSGPPTSLSRARFHNILKSVLSRPAGDLHQLRAQERRAHERDGPGGLLSPHRAVRSGAGIGAGRQMAALPRPPTATLERRVTEYRIALASQFDRLIDLARSREG